MATEQRILKQDGYLYVGEGGSGGAVVEMRNIVYHPQLNVILVFDTNNQVKILDVNSGVILQTYQLVATADSFISGRYMPLQDKILIWDCRNIGFRGDYNGVLLLDTILQTPIAQNDDNVRFEMLLSEAVIFHGCIIELESEGLECPCDVSNELLQKITKAQASAKKGIKAQRWNTICLNVQFSSLKLVANNVVIMLKRLERNIPVLAIASAINERLTDLLSNSRVGDFTMNFTNFQRVLMHSEAVRRQTFEKWPHMDYKWALPDQMAQAGFYHQPSATGEDRAMCFTCSVCLVCWEKTDEPWSEHERHSAMCPFVKGEYTQNVPLTVTYATSPAISAPGIGFDVISNSDYANVLCTSCSQTGDLTVWSIERHLKKMHTLNVMTLLKDVFEESFEWARITAICVLPNVRARSKLSSMFASHHSGGSSSSGPNTGSNGNINNTPQITSTSTLRAGVVGSKIVLGVSVRQSSGEYALRMVVLNIAELDRVIETSKTGSTDVGSNTHTGTTCQNPKSKPPTSSQSQATSTLYIDASMTNMPSLVPNNIDKQSFDDESKLDDDKSFSAYEKFVDGYDSNGFVSDLMDIKKAVNGAAGDNEMIYDFDLSTLLQSQDDPSGNGSGLMVNSVPNLNVDALNQMVEIDPEMEKIIEEAVSVQNINNNNNNNNESGGGANVSCSSSNNNNHAKVTISEEIECIVESWTTVKRMNALTSDTCDLSGSGLCSNSSSDVKEVIEITEIIPTNMQCNQLLVKLQKIKATDTETSKIIMATVEHEMEEEDERMECDDDNNADAMAAQLLLFDYDDAKISNDYTLALTFSRAKCPKYLCVLPYNSQVGERRSSIQTTDLDGNNSGGGGLEKGAICVVCADGTIEIYSLGDFQLNTTIEEEGEHFVSVAYCRSLDRLCGCTRQGALMFYSLSDSDNESGDEMLENDEECGATITQFSGNATILPELTVTDGTMVGGLGEGGAQSLENMPHNTSLSPPKCNAGSNISSDLSVSGNIGLTVNPTDSSSSNNDGGTPSCGGSVSSITGAVHSSPSSSSVTTNQSNLLAYKQSNLTLEDLQTLYALTQFDDKLTTYSAEVPSCWNDLGQAQKQRKQSQNLRHGEESQCIKTWRLHNDATTWDEHIIELNLAQQVSLGHIDLKFTVYQQCLNPAAIQVTLLKQNSSGFGYRLKGPHISYKTSIVDDNIDLSYIANENPVLSEEYLQTHNAEVLAGPIELSSCIDLCDQGGTATLTSPKLFKTRSRSFLLHIKTVQDPSKEGQNKTRVKNRKRVTTPKRPHSVEKLLQKLQSNLVPPNPGTTTANTVKISHSHKKSTANINNNPVMLTKKIRAVSHIGCDWLHEISISVRGFKSHFNISNCRVQRIAMLESNILLENLFKIVSDGDTTILQKNMALDILIWICFIRLNRFRSPKSERIKDQINKSTAANMNDLSAQQFECICIAEKFIENTIRYCILHSERSMAHKCVKLVLILTEGISNLPPELQKHLTLDATIKVAIASTFNELPLSKSGGAVRWYTMLVCATSTIESHNNISELCINLLTAISKEMNNRNDQYCALLGTRFGLYGFPFEPEIFDYDFPNINRNGLNCAAALTNVVRSSAVIAPVTGLDIKRLSSIDGVDFRTFPHLIRGKSVSNQLRGLLEVVQLHFTCVSTSEATRLDNMDSVTINGTSNILIDDLVTMHPNSVDLPKDKDDVLVHCVHDNLHNFSNVTTLSNDHLQINDIVSGVQNIVDQIKTKGGKKIDNNETPNGFKPIALPKYKSKKSVHMDDKYISKKFCLLHDLINEVADDPSQLNCSSDDSSVIAAAIIANDINSAIFQAPVTHLHDDDLNDPLLVDMDSSDGWKMMSPRDTEPTSASASNKKNKGGNSKEQAKDQQKRYNEAIDNANNATSTILPWHKLLTPPPKQIIVIDRMHSGARRHVVLDFGMPVLLTDLVIPACDDLTSLYIDIWCFMEETDGIRLVSSTDINNKTLVLSDLQPAPICRYMKITIIGRIGMSSTKCKIPLGSFFGHPIVLEHDGYGDPVMRCIKHPPQNIQLQIKALNSLYEDVHCRYSLASCKLMELLTPILNCELSNVAHMQAFINKQRIEEDNGIDCSKIVSIYEECITLQYQINVIRNVIIRLESSLQNNMRIVPMSVEKALQLASRDKLRVLGISLVEILLHFSIEYGIKNILPVHTLFTAEVANMLFDSLVVHGDAHVQLATCSLLVRMCCFQSWWGDFLADIFCNLFSSQNCKVFPQDRIFFLLTYLGRRSIAMGTCRSIVIDAVLKTLVRNLAPISTLYQGPENSNQVGGVFGNSSDLQLITWLLMFLSVCLDDNSDRKDKSSNRWDFMSCEGDFTKTRPSGNQSSKQLRCFKKRIIQQNKYGMQPYTDWGKKIYMLQNNHPGIFMEISGKQKPAGIGNKPSSSSSSSSSNKQSNNLTKCVRDMSQETESNFDKGLKTLRLNNILIVIRSLITLLLEMDFTCNMDQFLLTCKVIARLVAACRPAVQLSRVITTAQLEQLIRLAVWNDQQQPWAVHAITCLLQDLLDADKQFKDNDATPTNDSRVEGLPEMKDFMSEYIGMTFIPQTIQSMGPSNTELYQEAVKHNYLPSLIECEDTDFDDILNDIDMIERVKAPTKKESNALSKNTFNFFCKSISVAMDARLDIGLELNIETQLRRLTNTTSLDLYSSLPQILSSEFISTPPESTIWPEYITSLWSGPEYKTGTNTFKMFKNVFDCIFGDLHFEDTWVHLEQVLHMWLTLNGELSDKPFNTSFSCNDVPKIPFGANAVQGLLLSLAWHNDIKLRTWCLGFQCLFLACNSQSLADDDDCTRIDEVIVNDENFEKMLLRFFSGYGMSSSIISNRCVRAGPTICRHLHDLLLWLHKKGESTDGVISCRRKLKDILLHVILQLVQPGGAISNQQGPIDAQSQLVRDLLMMPNDKSDLNVSLNIIESVSFLVYNNISNGDKLQCQRSAESNTTNAFSNLFANVLGSESSKPGTSASDSSLTVNLLKLSASLLQTELPRQPSEVPIPEEEELTSQSQTDETKAEQQHTEVHRANKVPCIADTVLRHFPTMKRLLGSLSQCSSCAFSWISSSSYFEPQTTADAVFNMLMTLCEKASHPRLIVAPICQYLETSTIQRNMLPRLQLSEPFLWFITKALEPTAAVQIFTQLNGINIICQNLVKLNKILVNVQPGLISLIMQHMTKNTKLKLNTSNNGNGNCKPKTSAAPTAPPPRGQLDGMINFAPFCSISSENDTAQSADILISNPSAPHRRPRTPAWSYMFYPNESHVELTITLPTAVLLKEVQLQPHAPNLASCPSAVALEISRDYGLNAIPVGPPMTTTGLTCIRLKLAKAEIATSIVLRLYRPKDSSSIGLTQIAVLGQTIFSNKSQPMSIQSGQAMPVGVNFPGYDTSSDDDTFAKTSIGWVRILSRCFSAAATHPDSKLSADVIGASAAYPGFLEACCSLMNIMPMIPNSAQQHLETILLKLGAYNRDLSLQLLRILLWNTTPQIFKLSNEAICDLVYELSIINDAYIVDKLEVLLGWVSKLHDNYSKQARCNNPQSGFVKVIASILWHVHSKTQLANLPDLITFNLFETCLLWVDTLDCEEPLKVAFDSLLCALCYIKPELFNHLLHKVNVTLQDDPVNATLTDDNKERSGSEWFANVATDNLTTLLEKPNYLPTLALASQSPSAVYQLIDSGLPKLLSHALYEYCHSLLPEEKEKETIDVNNGDESSSSMPVSDSSNIHNRSCLTDADKAHSSSSQNMQTDYRNGSSVGTATLDSDSCIPLLNCIHVPKILDFFSECCAEGPMRDWLGTQQGSIFWKPLLELLCNIRPIEFAGSEPLQRTFIRMERSTINFFTRITACHPKNQDTMTTLLISVIRNPLPTMGKLTISGFTRQIVLQLLLENERILVSLRSKETLQKKDMLPAVLNPAAMTNVTFNNNSGISMAYTNQHPSKRMNAHHLLFTVSTSTKCIDILENCVSVVYASTVCAPTLQTETSRPADASQQESAAASSKNSDSLTENDKAVLQVLNFNNIENGMEFLSVAAGVTAKDKRIKDVKNQVAANKEKEIYSVPRFDFLNERTMFGLGRHIQLVHPEYPEMLLTSDATISQVLATLNKAGFSLSTPCLTLDLIEAPISQNNEGEQQQQQSNNSMNCVNSNNSVDPKVKKASCSEPLPSPLQRFSSRGGLSLLAHYLPTVYPELSVRKAPPTVSDKEKSPPLNDWVKLEPNDEIYEDLEDPISEHTAKHATFSSVPQHSLAAFGLFLRLPSYSEVLLRDKLRAQCLLRLVLGVTGDGEGNDIYSLSLAPSLPTLPFEVFRHLLDGSPLTTDDGMLLRRVVIDVGAMHLVLNCLSIFTHQSQSFQINSPQNDIPTGGIKPTVEEVPVTSDDKSHMYWAKGTGFGTGSTLQSWNVEQALLRQKSEEEHVTVLLQVLSSYINPGDRIPAALQCDEILAYHEINEVMGELPSAFLILLQQSCLIPALSSYLRNDSVLDITRHIPLYRAILQLLRALSLSQQLVSLLQPGYNGMEQSLSIAELLTNMKTCVDTYAKRLKVNKKSNIKGQTQQVTVNIDDGDDEGLALLIPDIHETALLVQKTHAIEMNNQEQQKDADGMPIANVDRSLPVKSLEQRYLDVMKKLQFDTYDMMVESENNSFRFVVGHHFEKMVRLAGDRYHPSRVKRLAQEAVTLSTSLPLSYSSSVFVRCDTDRLDVMKVLITGPADTPYANGCFEFDVFFPPDYPNLPMLINLETTGRHSVRFNPNLYNDGKVCLSVLNTWHGRPEEKWNAQTSSFLQVLVSIQSLILVPEPYFNEPGFERSRGTPSGTHSSREYNSNIYQACVRWAMLEQIRNPSPCFKDVIQTHFWLKRNEICSQIETWIDELSKPQFSERNSRTISFNSMVLRRHYRHLREELSKLKVPEGLEDLETPFNPSVTLPPSINDVGTNTTTTVTTSQCTAPDGRLILPLAGGKSIEVEIETLPTNPPEDSNIPATSMNMYDMLAALTPVSMEVDSFKGFPDPDDEGPTTTSNLLEQELESQLGSGNVVMHEDGFFIDMEGEDEQLQQLNQQSPEDDSVLDTTMMTNDDEDSLFTAPKAKKSTWDTEEDSS